MKKATWIRASNVTKHMPDFSIIKKNDPHKYSLITIQNARGVTVLKLCLVAWVARAIWVIVFRIRLESRYILNYIFELRVEFRYIGGMLSIAGGWQKTNIMEVYK